MSFANIDENRGASTRKSRENVWTSISNVSQDGSSSRVTTRQREQYERERGVGLDPGHGNGNDADFVRLHREVTDSLIRFDQLCQALHACVNHENREASIRRSQANPFYAGSGSGSGSGSGCQRMDRIDRMHILIDSATETAKLAKDLLAEFNAFDNEQDHVDFDMSVNKTRQRKSTFRKLTKDFERQCKNYEEIMKKAFEKQGYLSTSSNLQRKLRGNDLYPNVVNVSQDLVDHHSHNIEDLKNKEEVEKERLLKLEIMQYRDGDLVMQETELKHLQHSVIEVNEIFKVNA